MDENMPIEDQRRPRRSSALAEIPEGVIFLLQGAKQGANRPSCARVKFTTNTVIGPVLESVKPRCSSALALEVTRM